MSMQGILLRQSANTKLLTLTSSWIVARSTQLQGFSSSPQHQDPHWWSRVSRALFPVSQQNSPDAEVSDVSTFRIPPAVGRPVKVSMQKQDIPKSSADDAFIPMSHEAELFSGHLMKTAMVMITLPLAGILFGQGTERDVAINPIILQVGS
jgi:hypothetical protein